MLNDIHRLTMAGTYLGVPVACQLGYKQLIDDPVIRPGRDLILSWFGNPAGPWRNLRALLSDQLNWECAVSAYADKVDTVFLNDGEGLVATASMPSTHSIQFNCPALIPHDDAYEGRFFMPGIPIASTFRSGFTVAMNASLLVFEAAALSVDSITSAEADAYRVVPHAGYLDKDALQEDVEGFLPYHTEFVKIIGNRRADNCGAFTGGGDGDFSPYTIPTEPL